MRKLHSRATWYGCYALLAGGLICATLCACAPGIQWRAYTFDPVFEESQRDDKLTFVYLRSWADPKCTQFEEQVLKSPRVLQATGALYCVPLEFAIDRELAQRWEVEASPAVVLLDPDGRVLTKLSGEITIERLLSAVASAQTTHAVAKETAP